MKNPHWLFFLIPLLTACETPIGPQWERLGTPAQNKLQVIAAASDSQLWIAGGLRYAEECLMHSSDQGSSWEKLEDIFGQSWYDGCFTDAQYGYFCGISGKTMFTHDGGQSWKIRQLGGRDGWLPMRSIDAYDEVVLAVGGVAYDIGIIARSADRGQSWQIIDDSLEVELRDVLFVDQQTAFACGFGSIYRSRDAGLSWELLPAKGEFFTSMAFVNPQTGFAVGRTGSILRTRDGGDSWETVRNGDAVHTAQHYYNHIAFWDEDKGYILGDKGLVLFTEDGGAHWQKLQNDFKDDLFSLWLLGENEGLISGDNGCLLYFSF